MPNKKKSSSVSGSLKMKEEVHGKMIMKREKSERRSIPFLEEEDEL